MFITCPYSVVFLPMSDSVGDITDCDHEYHLTYEDVSGTILERNATEGSIYISEPVGSTTGLAWAKDVAPDEARRMMLHPGIELCPPEFIAILAETISLDDAAEREAAYQEEQQAAEFRRWQEDEYGKGI